MVVQAVHVPSGIVVSDSTGRSQKDCADNCVAALGRILEARRAEGKPIMSLESVRAEKARVEAEIATFLSTKFKQLYDTVGFSPIGLNVESQGMVERSLNGSVTSQHWITSVKIDMGSV